MFKWLEEADLKEKKIQLAANIYIQLCSTRVHEHPKYMAEKAFDAADIFINELKQRNK